MCSDLCGHFPRFHHFPATNLTHRHRHCHACLIAVSRRASFFVIFVQDERKPLCSHFMCYAWRMCDINRKTQLPIPWQCPRCWSAQLVRVLLTTLTTLSARLKSTRPGKPKYRYTESIGQVNGTAEISRLRIRTGVRGVLAAVSRLEHCGSWVMPALGHKSWLKGWYFNTVGWARTQVANHGWARHSSIATKIG